jgi:hypothetical protein
LCTFGTRCKYGPARCRNCHCEPAQTLEPALQALLASLHVGRR